MKDGLALPTPKLKGEYPQKILILSDEHRGAQSSYFHKYRASILSLMASGKYQHVVEVGDNVELLRIRNEYAEEYAGLLDMVAGKGTKFWTHEIASKKHDRYHRTEGTIRGEISFLQEFLDRYPHVTIHKVLGNHENIRKFRNELDELQKHNRNFEWSPEAIRIGDALFTHSHLHFAKKTDEQYPQLRLRDADKKGKMRRELYDQFHKAEHYVIKFFQYPKRASRVMEWMLNNWDGTGQFHYVHERSDPIVFTKEWVKHVFFGHTHFKCDNLERNGVLYHNTGAIIDETAQSPDDLGILQAQLDEDGTISKVEPVQVFKDYKAKFAHER